MGEVIVARVLVLCVLSLVWGAFGVVGLNAEGLASQGSKIFTTFEKKLIVEFIE